MSYPDKELNSYVLQYLAAKKINLVDLAKDVLTIQGPYYTDLTIEECEFAINKVLGKRDVLQHLATSIQLDKLAAKNKLDEPLLSIIKNDLGLYGVDETMALGITQNYGNIAVTNFGYLDKKKITVANSLDAEQKENNKKVNTFLDDGISAVVSCAAAIIAHSKNI